MGKCDCYHTKESVGGAIYGICYGTRECEICSCGGDESKCDFYPEKRKKANKMLNTAEMWLKAQEDGKIYCCQDMAYGRDIGWVDKQTLKDFWGLDAFINSRDRVRDLDKLMQCSWEEMPPTMTRKEAEEKLGVKIVD